MSDAPTPPAEPAPEAQPTAQPAPAEPIATTQETPAPKPPLTKQPWFWPVATGAAGLVLGLILGSAVTGAVTNMQQSIASSSAANAAEKAKATLFADAAEECAIKSLVDVADEGKTLVVDGAGEDFGSGDVKYDKLECIIDAVGTPTSVKSLMFETRSLDGRQEGDWEVDGTQVKASWGYHPDNGLDIIFEIDD
ncbi:hypothetical protein [Leifsonia sp. Leaf264]|uniref:hypothetical protein n=1 Tax=Leifsonia sp. Leaf264 TaxID=1736314 RepID=UPI0006F9E698|nr:hypothetical protein [Leifsonia sp. Leaf264]KQO98126.1 hypothetical protein ASF30_08535 [Leifsonia sp. Leaf264]